MDTTTGIRGMRSHRFVQRMPSHFAMLFSHSAWVMLPAPGHPAVPVRSQSAAERSRSAVFVRDRR